MQRDRDSGRERERRGRQTTSREIQKMVALALGKMMNRR